MTRVLVLTGTAAVEAPLAQAVRSLDASVSCLLGSEPHDEAALAGVEVVLGWRFPPGYVQKLSGLRWVCSMAAGVEKLLVPELPPAVPVSRVVDPVQALGMAQFAALLVLQHAREMPHYAVQQRARDWTRKPIAVVRARVLVLGMGEVGREVARVLQALGLEVRGWRRDGTPLHAALAAADFVVNVLPLTPATTGLLDAPAFAAMPRGSYLVNIARGGHVVEADLVAAVRSGQLSGAALDVQQREPLPADDPLWDVPGITITPHIASQPDTLTVARQFVTALQAFREGRPLPNAVDRNRGY